MTYITRVFPLHPSVPTYIHTYVYVCKYADSVCSALT